LGQNEGQTQQRLINQIHLIFFNLPLSHSWRLAYCIKVFIQHFSQHKPNRSALSGFKVTSIYCAKQIERTKVLYKQLASNVFK